MLHELQNLLEKFYALRPPQAAIREVVVATVRRHCDIELQESEIECRNNIVYLKTSPIARGEILLQREVILKALAEQHRMPLRDLR